MAVVFCILWMIFSICVLAAVRLGLTYTTWRPFIAAAIIPDLIGAAVLAASLSGAFRAPSAPPPPGMR
jgi:hypothetical protein